MASNEEKLLSEVYANLIDENLKARETELEEVQQRRDFLESELHKLKQLKASYHENFPEEITIGGDLWEKKEEIMERKWSLGRNIENINRINEQRTKILRELHQHIASIEEELWLLEDAEKALLEAFGEIDIEEINNEKPFEDMNIQDVDQPSEQNPNNELQISEVVQIPINENHPLEFVQIPTGLRSPVPTPKIGRLDAQPIPTLKNRLIMHRQFPGDPPGKARTEEGVIYDIVKCDPKKTLGDFSRGSIRVEREQIIDFTDQELLDKERHIIDSCFSSKGKADVRVVAAADLHKYTNLSNQPGKKKKKAPGTYENCIHNLHVIHDLLRERGYQVILGSRVEFILQGKTRENVEAGKRFECPYSTIIPIPNDNI